ncbi:hypothetical protein VTO73DRAFT_3724 [Trametes versicolor]
MPETSTTAAINPQPPQTGTDGAPRPRNRRRGGASNPQPDHGENPSTAGGPDSGSNAKGARRPRRPRAPAGATDGHSANNAEAGIEAGRPPSAADGQSTRNKRSRRNHGRNFQGELTEGAGEGTRQDTRSLEKYRSNAPVKDDLTSRLTYDLSTPPYPDCLICFAPITPAQATWSCSPSHPTMVGSDDEHGRCGGLASERGGEGGRLEMPRMPVETQGRAEQLLVFLWIYTGSQTAASGYTTLLCQSMLTAARMRSSVFPHLPSWAVPSLSSHDSDAMLLYCGNHTCADPCHPGSCKPCPVKVSARCYCGKDEKELSCGEGEEKECRVVQDGKEDSWVGRFACENTCDRPFDCGIHHCSKPCHPPSPNPVPCPHSPSIVTHCPCGKHALTPDSAPFFSPNTLLTRTACTDPVPTCASTCMKPLDGCDHVCSVRCHTGPCPPCSIMIVRPCRCGSTTREVRCFEDAARARARARGETGPNVEITCERPCGALRACGRHQCNRLCCPLASLAGLTKGKGKKRAGAGGDALAFVDQEGWHECDLVCGKLLSCGNHHCEEQDHKGPCPPCLRSSFEEMICNCGRTVLEPPIPCGTRIACTYPCHRDRPCGHPQTHHACHEDPAPCPPCPFLTTKKCACGKKTVDNVRCSQEKVSCGTACGKLLGCGFHHCERLCHGDSCGPCHAPCGKPRKLCMPAIHPCTLSCHAPASCDESEPCRSIVTISCPCGRIRQSVPCGRSMTNPAREGGQQLKCTNECGIAKRNARLAEALGINPERADSRLSQVSYNDDLTTFARANAKFCAIVEKSFADFLASDKKSQILPHMPEQKRKFVHDLAGVYRLDTQMVDQEPHRSVQLLRRIDSRVPAPLLSAAAAPGPSGLGKLADLRAGGLQPLARPGSALRASPAPAPAGRGWTSVVARQPVAAPAPSSWGGTPARTPTPARSSNPSPVPGPSRVAAVPAPVVVAPVNPEDVPDNWEDEV